MACGDGEAPDADEAALPPRRNRADAGSSDGEAIEPTTGDAAAAPRTDRYREGVLADDPVAYWRFDDAPGGIVADERGAYPGSYVGSVELGTRGLFGATGAVTFPDGTNAHVLVPGDVFRFADAAPFTIEVWVQAAKVDDDQFIGGTDVRDANGRRGWSVSTVNTLGQTRFEIWDSADGGGSPIRTSAMGTLTLGEFRHLVVTFNGSALRSYLDGKAGGSSTVTPPKLAPSVGVLRWGARAVASGVSGGLDGWSIDEAAVYDYALPPERITAHFELGRPQ